MQFVNEKGGSKMSSNTYNGVLIRNNLSGKGGAESPDIIPYGDEPVKEPLTFFIANYKQDVGKALIENVENYLYLRGKNFSENTVIGKFYLYYAKPSLILYPDQWENNALQTSTGQTSVPFTVNPGEIAITVNPFTWTPQNSSCCLIGRIVTPVHPNPIPQVGDIFDYSSWRQNNRATAFRNITLVSRDSTSWTQDVYYSQGAIGAKVQFIITCTNVPVGAKVALSAGTPGPTPVMDIEPTTVTNAASFVVGMECYVPADYTSNISFSYWANGNIPPKGFSIKMSAQVVVPPGHELYEGAFTQKDQGTTKGIEWPQKKVVSLGEYSMIGF
jgi:hypothetical protein